MKRMDVMGSCSAIFVQRRSNGAYWVWPGPTQVDHEPNPAARDFIVEFPDRGSALCAAHDADRGTSDGVVEVADEPQPRLYRHVWITGQGYVVYRHCFDDTKCSIEEGAMAHRTATFVAENEAADYCRYRNELTEKNGTDELPEHPYLPG